MVVKIKIGIKNKRGWLRILEAVIGIMIIAGVLMLMYSRTIERPSISDYIYNLETKILKDISENDIYRSQILSYDGDNAPKDIINFVNSSLPDSLDFRVRVCDINSPCSISDVTAKNIFVEERMISSNLDYYNPKKIRLFVWQA